MLNLIPKIDIKYILILILIIIIILILRCIFINHIDYFQLYFEKDNSINKTYIICNKSFYNVMEDYILSFYKQLNATILSFDNEDDIPIIQPNNIYIFVKTIHGKQLEQLNNDTKNVYLLNTEQLVLFDHLPRLNSYPKYIKMLDYNKANLKYYDGYYTKFLQYQINFDEIYNIPKIKGICIMSNISEYRQTIINNIKIKNVNIDIIDGWKKERDFELFSHKILLNLGYTDKYKIFESLRCDRCIFNKMIIISDKKEDIELYYLKNYIIFEDYDKIADKAIEVLNNYDMYYKQLGLDTLDLKTLQIEPVSL